MASSSKFNSSILYFSSGRFGFSSAIYLFLILFAGLLFAVPVKAEWHSDTQGIMGTEVSVSLWHSDAAIAVEAINAVMTEMRRIDALLSPYKPDSELSKVNDRAFKSSQSLSDQFNYLIDKSIFYGRLTEGAFDITFASLASYYDYREQKKPNSTDIERALPAIDYEWLEHDVKAATLRFAHPKVKIDLGGLAKGWAVDRGISILRQFGIEHASVSAGGDSQVLGDRRGRPWLIGIKHPRLNESDQDKAVIRLPLENVAVSTSGDYERFFIDEQTGERVHHIINPKTGKSANEVMSVTVLGQRGVDTDPLSTAVFVLGVQKGIELIDKLPNFDAIIIDISGKVHYSEGLAAGE